MAPQLSRRSFVTSIVAATLGCRLVPGARDQASATPRRSISQRVERMVVVGAGAFGGWTALSLLRAGMHVTLVDAWGPGNSRASSGGETRVWRTGYGAMATYTELAATALRLWLLEERRWNRKIFFPTGLVWMFGGGDEYIRSSIAPIRAHGFDVEELSLAQASRRYPQLGLDGVQTIFVEPHAGFLAARASCELVRESFVAEGGEYRQGRVAPPGERGTSLHRISLSDGSTLSADRFVFACGPWMGEMFPDAIGRRIIATRQEVFFFGTPAGDTRYDAGALPVWAYMSDGLVYGVPSHEGRGVKIADDRQGPEIDPTSLERVPSEAGVANARRILRERLPGLGDAPLVDARVCQYEASSDGHYVIDLHPRLENVWLVGGGSGHGFKVGPAIGEHVAGLIQGRASVNAMFAHARLQPTP